MPARLRLSLLMLLALIGCVDKTVISRGDRVAIITKFSNKLHCRGIWTWEGELAMIAGTNATGQGVGEIHASVWKFSLGVNPDQSLVQEIKNMMDSGHRARISYAQQSSADPCEAESDYIAIAIGDLDAR